MSPHWPAQVIMCQSEPNEQTETDTRLSRNLSTHLVMSPRGHTLTEQIEEGSFYEINRSKLPPRTPTLLLQSIRVVMVTVKSDQNLTVRYPSTNSLEAYFNDPSQNLYPEMDEKYIMGSQLASEVLIRRISSHEFTRNSSLKSFWFAQNSDMKSKLGSCLSELQSSNIKSWGERRLVSYIRNTGKKSSHSTCTIVEKSEVEEEDQETVEAANDDGQEVLDIVLVDIKTEMDCEIDPMIQTTRKRKRKSSVKNKNNRKIAPANVKKAIKSDPDSFRWSTQRYEAAKQELYAVMKAKDAAFTNPITRYELRAEARKKIGDTGLLDHLLKHVIDTLAPGGTERFKRRWDSKGVMEYWLENADLDDIRKNAGVQDPYWTPPPGWTPGDPVCNHTSDCYSVITALKEELAKIRGDSVLSSLADIESLNPAMFKERYNDMLKEKARREKELMEITSFLKKMELLMKKQSGGLDG